MGGAQLAKRVVDEMRVEMISKAADSMGPEWCNIRYYIIAITHIS